MKKILVLLIMVFAVSCPVFAGDYPIGDFVVMIPDTYIEITDEEVKGSVDYMFTTPDLSGVMSLMLMEFQTDYDAILSPRVFYEACVEDVTKAHPLKMYEINAGKVYSFRLDTGMVYEMVVNGKQILSFILDDDKPGTHIFEMEDIIEGLLHK